MERATLGYIALAILAALALRKVFPSGIPTEFVPPNEQPLQRWTANDNGATMFLRE